MQKNQSINLWFQPIKKKTCPCGEKKTEVYALGEYRSVRWNTVEHFCQVCFEKRVMDRYRIRERFPMFQVRARSGYTLPQWLKKEEKP